MSGSVFRSGYLLIVMVESYSMGRKRLRIDRSGSIIMLFQSSFP